MLALALAFTLPLGSGCDSATTTKDSAHPEKSKSDKDEANKDETNKDANKDDGKFEPPPAT